MFSLVRPFFQICLLRLAPQDLPASWLLLSIALGAHVVSAVLVSTVNLELSRAVLAGLTDTALLCGLTGLLLVLQQRAARLVQTLTALTGTGAIIGFVALPVSVWLRDLQAGAIEGAAPAVPAAVVLLTLMGWSLAVAAHILRHALSAPFFLGLVVAVSLYLASIVILQSLFPIGG